jgi:hypothetical protein
MVSNGGSNNFSTACHHVTCNMFHGTISMSARPSLTTSPVGPLNNEGEMSAPPGDVCIL